MEFLFNYLIRFLNWYFSYLSVRVFNVFQDVIYLKTNTEGDLKVAEE